MPFFIVSYHSLPCPSSFPLKAWDPNSLVVAAKVIQLLQGELSGLNVEHIGSTSVPGCDGKGIIDLMVVVPDGKMTFVSASVDRVGFQRQSGGVIHSDERPMREGGVEYDGEFFRIHVHLVPENTSHVNELREFRERLAADPALVARYIDRKRELETMPLSDRAAYTRMKGAFIRSILEERP